MKQDWFEKSILPKREQLHRYARRFLGNTDQTEDVIQELYLRLWNSADKYMDHPNTMGLCRQITKNLCLDHIKLKKSATYQDQILNGHSMGETPHIRLELKDSVEKVLDIIDRLPSLQKLIFRMKHIDGYEIEEIAWITGSKPEAIKMNLSRARRKVSEEFKKIDSYES